MELAAEKGGVGPPKGGGVLGKVCPDSRRSGTGAVRGSAGDCDAEKWARCGLLMFGVQRGAGRGGTQGGGQVTMLALGVSGWGC